MSRTTYRRIERGIIVGMMLGIIGMFQPFGIEAYNYGFHLLFACTLAFIVFSHLQPQTED
jgi:uncharacterized membrane protein YfhO